MGLNNPNKPHTEAQVAKFQDMLPLTTCYGVIAGFIPDSWMVSLRGHTPRSAFTRFGGPYPKPSPYQYGRCCQDPCNWVGRGSWRELSMDPLLQDPWSLYGFTQARDVGCRGCDTRINATEYGGKQP